MAEHHVAFDEMPDIGMIPETYTILSTAHVPNSPLPYLVYRNVLPKPYEVEAITEFIHSKSGWRRRVKLPNYP